MDSQNGLHNSAPVQEDSPNQGGDQPPRVLFKELLGGYLRPLDRAQKRQYLREHPELLSLEADHLMEIQCADQKTDSLRSFMERTRSELKACREKGIDQALPDEPSASGAPNLELVRTLFAFMAFLSWPQAPGLEILKRHEPPIETSAKPHWRKV